MKRSYAVLPFSLLLSLTACSAENALVGGECAQGYSADGSKCVPIPAAPAPATTVGPPITTVTPNSKPSDPVTSTDPTTPVKPVDPNHPTDPPGTVTPTDPPGDTTPPIVIVEPPSTVTCTDTLVECRGGCLPVATDGQNCGACGRICPSNICVDGECQGVTPGDIVVIGHDMAKAQQYSTHAKVFQNAVHLPTTDPLRILAFEADADPTAVDNTRSLAATITNRGVRIGQATPENLEDPNLYANWDVVLIDGVATENAHDYGTRWATALDTFTKKGGVLVALDSGQGDLPSLLDVTGIIDVGAHMALPDGTQFKVSAPNDTVGAQLLSPYAAFGPSVAFFGADAVTTTWVVQTADSFAYPTVLHKVAR